jgi:hypothetical protein
VVRTWAGSYVDIPWWDVDCWRRYVTGHLRAWWYRW